MTSTKTPAQIKINYVQLMGPQAGEAFAELMQDAARLHLKWNEFLALFAASLAQIDTLNKAAPGFFYLVSEAWWDGPILHIFRMTDANGKVLSLVTLKHLLPAAIRAGYEPKLKLALAASRFAHDTGFTLSATSRFRWPISAWRRSAEGWLGLADAGLDRPAYA